MRTLTWIVDPTTGDTTVEGMTAGRAAALVDDLLPAPRVVNCARPLASAPLPSPTAGGPTLRVARIYHGSVVDGPGRRSVVQLQGCPIRCPGCYVPETHDPAGGVALTVTAIVASLLEQAGQPRDGVTVIGGEPFVQVAGLVLLLRRLKARGVHTTVYTGYTLKALARRPEAEVREAIGLVDLMVDGPFVAALANGAGEWRGSRNQRLITQPAAVLTARPEPSPS